MSKETTSLSERATALANRIDEMQGQLGQHGVLDGEDRLRAREAAIEIAKLREQIEHFGQSDAGRHASDAANAEALRTQLDYWTAQIDRKFKA